MPGRRPGIALIDFPIDQTIEKHRGGSGGDHACQHQEQNPEAGLSIRRHNQRRKRERQRKNRVRKPDQPKEACERAAAILSPREIVQHFLLVHGESNDASRSLPLAMMGFPCAKKMQLKSQSRRRRNERIICFWLVQYFLGKRSKP